MKATVLMVLLSCLVSCENNTNNLATEQTKVSPTNYELSIYYAHETDSLTTVDSCLLEETSIKCNLQQKQYLLNESDAWSELRDEMENYLYLMVAAPKWYNGAEGIIDYYAKRRDMTYAHLIMHKNDNMGDPDSLVHYFAPNLSLRIFLECCQCALEILPSSPCNDYTEEQNQELMQCYQSANESFIKLSDLTQRWILAREQLSDSFNTLDSQESWTRPKYIDCHTSDLLIELAKIVSPKYY